MSIKLSRFVGVRFQPDDYQRLEEKAKSLGIPISQLIRSAALNRPVTPRRRALADQDLINQLSRLGNNLNQQTRLLHQLHHRGLPPDIAPVLSLLREVRDLLHEVAHSVAEVAR